MADFVERAKLERQLIKAEKTAKAATQSRSEAGSTAMLPSTLLTRYVQPALTLALVFLYWSTPIAILPSRWFAPLTWVMRSPGFPAGTIGAFAWVLLCNSVISPLVRWAAAKAGVTAAQPAPPENMMQKAMKLMSAFGGGGGRRAKAE